MGRGAAQHLIDKLKRRPDAPPVYTLPDLDRGEPLLRSHATEQMVEDYGHDFCHVLARELHQRYGWKMRAVGDAVNPWTARPWRGLSGIPSHVYCINDDGLPVDVYGVFESEQAIARFYSHPQEEMDENAYEDVDLDAIDELVDRGYLPYREREIALTEKAADQLALDRLRV